MFGNIDLKVKKKDQFFCVSYGEKNLEKRWFWSKDTIFSGCAIGKYVRVLMKKTKVKKTKVNDVITLKV